MATLQETLQPLSGNNERYLKRLLSRVKKAHAFPSDESINCIGVALYLTGELRRATFVETRFEASNLLSKLDRLEGPQLGCLIAWQKKDPDPSEEKVLHLGVVTSLDPLLITSRVHCGREFHENDQFGDLNRAFENEKDVEVIFYRPRHLKLKDLSDAAKPADSSLKAALRGISPPDYLSKLHAQIEQTRDNPRKLNEKVRNR